MRSALAYVPRRRPLQMAAPPAALFLCLSPVVVAFTFSNPIVLAGAGAASLVAAVAAGAGRAVFASLRWGLALALMIVAVNALVTHRGLTVLVRGGEVPVLGTMDITLEAMAAGGVIALRILVVLAAFSVYSTCVDPDGVLRLIRPIARRSALTASLIARMVPLAAADASRLGEAAALRGPAAAPVGRAALARRLVAGSLDRAVDVAATLELRGYALPSARAPALDRRRSRRDGRFMAAGATIAATGIAARIAGVGDFDSYPALAMDAGPATLALAVALPALALLPFARRPARRRRVATASRAEGARA